MQQPGELDRADRRRQLRADRRRQVLDVGDPHDLRLLGRVTQTECGRSVWLDPARNDRMLLAILDAAQQPLAEVVVDGRVGAAPRRAGERDACSPQALAAREQLGRGADERRLAAADGEHEAAAERLAQDAEHRRGVMRRGRVHVDLAREHDLLELAGPDQLTARATAAS